MLEDSGYKVSRSASSKGIWDLSALKVGKDRETEIFVCLLVQVKNRKTIK